MKRFLQLFALFVIALASQPLGRASSSTATVILEPDFVCSAPGCRKLYIQGATNGVEIISPTGQDLIIGANQIAGAGKAHVCQGGTCMQWGGAATVVPVQALQLPVTLVNLTSAGTQVPAPDYGFPISTGATSNVHIQAVSGDLDWTGGIGTPLIPGASVFGARITLQNVGVYNVNIIDPCAGGSVYVGFPSISLGFYETATFDFDNFGWMLVSRGPGGLPQAAASNDGSQVFHTTDATLKHFAPFARACMGNGIAFTADVTAFISGTGATGYWQGVRCAWDAANVVTLPLAVEERSGNNSGDVPAGLSSALGCTQDSTNDYLNVTGLASTDITWHLNNLHMANPGFL